MRFSNENHMKRKTALEYVVTTTLSPTHTSPPHSLTKHDSLWDFFIRFSLILLVVSIHTNENSIHFEAKAGKKRKKKLMLFYFLYFVFRLSPNRFKCQLKSKCEKRKKNCWAECGWQSEWEKAEKKKRNKSFGSWCVCWSWSLNVIHSSR